MRKKRRSFEGQPQAERLAAWFNRQVQPDGLLMGSPECSRIQRLIFDIKYFPETIKTAREKGLEPDRRENPENWSAAEWNVYEDTKDLEDQLLRYWRSTRIKVSWPTADQEKNDVTFETAWLKDSEVSEEETNAFLDVLFLLRSGTLDRLRQCDTCPRWMAAKIRRGGRAQKHCSEECVRDWRLYYMREKNRQARKDEKDRQARAKAAVKTRRKK
jgi:hypothetical protein